MVVDLRGQEVPFPERHLEIGVLADASPVSYLTEEGEVKGFYYEVLIKILDELDITYDVTIDTFPNIYQGLLDGKYNMFPALLKNEEREKEIYFPEFPVYQGYSALFVKEESGFSKIQDIQGKKIALMTSDASGGIFFNLMQQFGIRFEPVYYNSFSEAEQSILNNEVYGTVGFFSIGREFDPSIIQTSFAYNPSSGYFTGALNQPQYVINMIDEISNRFFYLQNTNGSWYNELCEEYFEVVRVNTIPEWLIVSIFVLVIFIIVSSFIIRLLTRRVKKTNKELLELNKDLEKKILIASKEMSQIENQASIGRLTVSLAHEINTPIGVAYTSATFQNQKFQEFLKSYQGGTLKESEFIAFMDDSSKSFDLLVFNLERASELIQKLKTLSADQFSKENKREYELKEYSNDIFSTIYQKYKKQKKIIFVNESDEILAKQGNPTVFYQILSNLIINSIEHGFENRDKGVITLRMKVNQTYETIEFEYLDDGVGVPEDIINHIWEPFFTTKRSKGNTGLGLSSVYNLIKGNYNSKDLAIKNRLDGGFSLTFSFSIKGRGLTKEKNKFIII